MNSDKITKLVSVLSKNGSKVLCGGSKLILTFDLMREVNESLSLIDTHRMLTNSFELAISSDLKFLYNFIEQTVSLKLTPKKKKHGNVDLSKFKKLKLLEIYKLDVRNLMGLATLKRQLQFLICTNGSIVDINDVLKKCGGDDSEEGCWGELREAVFTYNLLSEMNGLEYAPSLHTLDLSHNDLQDVTGLNCLTNLKKLNLGFNKLLMVPSFNIQTCKGLEVLNLSSNFIDDISKITLLQNLIELDLCKNCLFEHRSLEPLANLSILKSLNLMGNPLSYHLQHRSKTCVCLHTNAGEDQFVLDGHFLSKNEKNLVGFVLRKTVSRTKSTESSSGTIVTEIIENDEPILMCNMSPYENKIKTYKHLKTKRDIEEIHKKYGDRWLCSEAALLVQACLGLECKNISYSAMYGTSGFIIQTELIESHHEEITSDQITNEDTSSETHLNCLKISEASERSFYNSYEETNDEITESDDDFIDGDKNLFVVLIKGQTEPVIFVITKTEIFERDYIDTKKQTRWSIETLVHYNIVDNYIEIHFDTVRKNHRQRVYLLDGNERQRLKDALSNIIENRPAAEYRLKKYKCVKCDTQLCAEKTKRMYDNQSLQCPSCGSYTVFEYKE